MPGPKGAPLAVEVEAVLRLPVMPLAQMVQLAELVEHLHFQGITLPPRQQQLLVLVDRVVEAVVVVED